MTTPRQIVAQTLAYQAPPRVARSFPPSDLIQVAPAVPDGEWRPVDERRWERIDGWGNVWGRVDATSKGEVVRGALEDLSAVEAFPLPNFDDPTLYEQAALVFEGFPEMWHVGFIHGFSFSMARKLRKLDQYFMDLVAEPERIAILHDRIDEQIIHQIRHMARVGADCIHFAEDWGTQENLFISPRLWRREFKPRFARLCAEAHALGLKVFMHSCGKITVIIPDLIEAGVDVFQFDQPLVHGLSTLAHFQDQYGVTFWCPVDIQEILPTRDTDRIQQAAREMLDVLWRGQGGFIAGYYPDLPSLGLDEKWQLYASAAFHGYALE